MPLGLLAAALALLCCSACGGGGAPRAPAPIRLAPTVPPSATSQGTPTPVVEVRSPLAATLAEADARLRAGQYAEAAAGFASVAAGSTEPAIVSRARLGQAIAAYEAGDAEGSVRLLRLALDSAAPDSLEQTRAVYLLGVRLSESGAFAEAAGVLAPHAVAGVGGALDPYVAAEYASALAGSGDLAGAAETWDELLADGETGDHLRATILRSRADLARAVGDSAAAAAALGELVALTRDHRARYELAGLALTLGDSATFAEQLGLIIAERPSTLEAVLAIGDLRAAGFAVDAGEEGYVLYRHRAYAEARSVLRVAAAEAGLTEADRAFRTYYLAAAHDDAGFYAEAVPLYDSVVALEGGGVYRHRAQYWAARSLEGAGDHAAAALRYDELYAAVPSGEFTAEAGFRAGFVRFRAGDSAGAVAAWAVLPAAEARTLYWLGRAQEQLGDGSGARAFFEGAVAQDARSFYGVEANRALGGVVTSDGFYRPLVAPAPPDWEAIEAWLGELAVGEPRTAIAPEVVELAAVGLRGPAGDVLDLALVGMDDPWALLALARVAYEAALPNQVARIALQLQVRLGLATSQLPESVAVLRYPLDYVGLLEAEGWERGVDPLLLAALVLQESLWHAEAVSIAGALGLTQVIPETAAGIAGALGRTDFELRDLFRPAVALEFGAYYVGGQLGRFGDLHLALAAYNGGPTNVGRWAGVAAWPPSEFVEAIEFPETRGYVESVISHYAWYQALYGSGRQAGR